MSTGTAFQAKARFGELLDRVNRGEEIVIIRHEKPVVRLVPKGGASLAHICQAVVNLTAGRSAMAKRRNFKPLTDRQIKQAVKEGSKVEALCGAAKSCCVRLLL